MKLTCAIVSSSSSRVGLAENCVDIVIQLSPVTSTSRMAVGSFEQLYLNMQAQSVRLGGEAQLLLVSTTSGV
jgi:hypothetical protein